MMNERATENDRDYLQTIVDLSNDWVFIFEKNLTIKLVYLHNNEIQQALETNFFNCLLKKDHGRFTRFFIDIVKGSSPIEETFSFFVNNQHYDLRIRGTWDGINVIMRGVIMESTNTSYEIINKLPVGAIAFHSNGCVAAWNSQVEGLIKHLGLAPLSKEEKLPKVELGNLYEKIQNIFFFMENAGEVKKETYKGKDVRLELQGLICNERTYLIFIKDESFQERYEQLLTYQQQMEAVSQIAAGVAHELRNPLSVIKGFLQLSRLSNDLNRYYETIFSEIDRMNKIIEDFLSVSKKKVEKQYIKPDQLLDSILMIFHSECMLQDIELSYNVMETNHYLFVNEQMIKQVLLNVLRNSIEAYEGQRTNRIFIINTDVRDGQYCIDLVDKGPGIPENVMAKIDQPFYTTKEKGTGIGIPLCKQLIEEHQGEFMIKSHEGKGTIVKLQLPLYNKGDEDS